MPSNIAGQYVVQSHVVGSIVSNPLMRIAGDFSEESHVLKLREAKQDGISLIGLGVSEI